MTKGVRRAADTMTRSRRAFMYGGGIVNLEKLANDQSLSLEYMDCFVAGNTNVFLSHGPDWLGVQARPPKRKGRDRDT